MHLLQFQVNLGRLWNENLRWQSMKKYIKFLVKIMQLQWNCWPRGLKKKKDNFFLFLPYNSFCSEAYMKTTWALFTAMNEDHSDAACSALHLTACHAPHFRATLHSSVGLSQWGPGGAGRAGAIVTESRSLLSARKLIRASHPW